MENTINFEEEFLGMHSDKPHILRYMKEALGKDELTWSDMTVLNLVAIAAYIKNKVTSNSAGIYFSAIKGFLNLFADEVRLPTTKYNSILKAKKEPQQNVALTEEEVEMVYNYYRDMATKNEKNLEAEVLNLFLIECYCGSRGVDVEAMSEKNICNGMLTYVSKKTHIMATMPVHHRLQGLLLDKTNKKYSRCTKNRILKRVCRNVGISYPVTIFYHGSMVTKPKYEFIGMHCARRSFASVLSAKGVPVSEIAQYMSHANISMTERYIKVNTNKASEAAMSFFSTND